MELLNEVSEEELAIDDHDEWNLDKNKNEPIEISIPYLSS